ncbi:hypothetical protein M408DRAFT_332056 [Serendipita vermifera MAFF 305830]|uniref:Uncharacterized protein n=1 Tax=Serendipita vermifera MAFF 305830 TaxID=933852 RepID=A0A0C3AH59_SERVB|nr:hypothetical protein M408DRAFT_332056 [Serendipita vermifera MAFF 305830]
MISYRSSPIVWSGSTTELPQTISCSDGDVTAENRISSLVAPIGPRIRAVPPFQAPPHLKDHPRA